jgi:GNAT superfamily N-acetyltransferase
MVIRHATPNDLPDIVKMGVQFWNESIYHDALGPATKEGLADVAQLLMSGNDRALFVADEDGDLIGMIGMAIYPHPVQRGRIASEVTWWVDPDSRGTAGVRLLRHAEEWAREQPDVQVLQVGAPDGEDDLESLVMAKGYQRLESSFSKRLD